MMDQYSKRLNGSLSSGKVLCLSLLTICIFAGPRARAGCPLVVPSGVEMTSKVRAIVGSKTNEGDLARCYLRYMDALNIPRRLTRSRLRMRAFMTWRLRAIRKARKD
jgi:hypothetical protein